MIVDKYLLAISSVQDAWTLDLKTAIRVVDKALKVRRGDLEDLEQIVNQERRRAGQTKE